MLNKAEGGATIEDLERVLKICENWEADATTKLIFSSLIHELCELTHQCKEQREASVRGDNAIMASVVELTAEVKELRNERLKDEGGAEVISRMGAAFLALGAAVLSSICTVLASRLL